MDNKREGSFRINIGAPSIILVLTVLGLSIFAILSVRAAYTGLKLAKNSELAALRYYEADAKAQRFLFDYGEILAEAEETGADSEFIRSRLEELDGVRSVEADSIVFEAYLNENSVLRLELAGDGTVPYRSMTVRSYRTVTDNTDEYNGSGLDIIDIDWMF